MATWDTRYQVTLDSSAANPKLALRGGKMVSCNCVGLCTVDASMDLPVIVASSQSAMLTKNLAFLRHTGGKVPQTGFRSSISAAGLSGSWSVLHGKPGSAHRGTLQLNSNGHAVQGSLVISSTTVIPRWKRRECRGATELTAKHRFSVAGTIKGGIVDFSFSHQETTDCSCQRACAAARHSVSNTPLQLALDGNHLVAPGLLVSRQ
jgi:hypothetical protein